MLSSESNHRLLKPRAVTTLRRVGDVNHLMEQCTGRDPTAATKFVTDVDVHRPPRLWVESRVAERFDFRKTRFEFRSSRFDFRVSRFDFHESRFDFRVFEDFFTTKSTKKNHKGHNVIN